LSRQFVNGPLHLTLQEDTGFIQPRVKVIKPFQKKIIFENFPFFPKFNHYALKKLHKYTHLNIELLKASNSEKMDHNIEWGKLYFLIASTSASAIIYINETPSLLFIVLVSFLCFCAKGSSQCTFSVNFSFTVYVFGEFFFSVRFGEFSVCLVTLSNFSLTAKIRCNINSTIRIVCYNIKGNFRTYVCKTILFHTYHNVQIQSVWEGGTNTCRAVGGSENLGVPVLYGGHNLPPLVEIGRVNWSAKIWGLAWHPRHHQGRQAWFNECLFSFFSGM